ncbi:MAG: CFI-box-CTERM domain-containing protein, partial [Nitrososphaerales archaeon]
MNRAGKWTLALILGFMLILQVGGHSLAPNAAFEPSHRAYASHTYETREGTRSVAYDEGLRAGLELQGCYTAGFEDARRGYDARPDFWIPGELDPEKGLNPYNPTVEQIHRTQFDAGAIEGCTSAYARGFETGIKEVEERERQRDTTTSSSSSEDIDDCLADLAFGGHYAPQVVTLRHYRDDIIGATPAGKVVVGVLTSWYYSFSPSIAAAEAGNPLFKQAVKMTLYPLVAILYVSEKAFYITDDEQASSAMSQLMAASLVGVTYFAPMVVIARNGLGRSEDGPNKKIMVVAVS